LGSQRYFAPSAKGVLTTPTLGSTTDQVAMAVEATEEEAAMAAEMVAVIDRHSSISFNQVGAAKPRLSM
jgi:hypothetical protein